MKRAVLEIWPPRVLRERKFKTRSIPFNFKMALSKKHAANKLGKCKQQRVGAKSKEGRSPKLLTVLKRAEGIKRNKSFSKILKKRDRAPERRAANE